MGCGAVASRWRLARTRPCVIAVFREVQPCDAGKALSGSHKNMEAAGVGPEQIE